MLTIGRKAPAFTLAGSDGKKFKLGNYHGEVVVLFFYPKDNTSGCTKEAKAFTEALECFEEHGATVVGVSRDSLESHRRFIAKHDLGILLLSDPGAKVHKKYGAWGTKNMYGKKVEGVLRTTVIVDSRGKVAGVFEKVRVKGHVEAVLETLDNVE